MAIVWRYRVGNKTFPYGIEEFAYHFMPGAGGGTRTHKDCSGGF